MAKGEAAMSQTVRNPIFARMWTRMVSREPEKVVAAAGACWRDSPVA